MPYYVMTTALASLAVAFSAPASAQAPRETTAETRLVGDLRQIAANTLTGSVPLGELTSAPHLYGLGMVDGLEGELLVLDGKAYLGRADRPLSESDLGKETLVAFGAFATVPKWEPIGIPESVSSFKDLQAFITKALSEREFDLLNPVPFRVEASAVGLRWFVVRGMGNLKPTPRESFARQIFRGGVDDVSFEAFGIHSTAHRGIYMNAISDIHIHFRTTDDRAFVAHLDDEISLKPGARLLLPLRTQ